MGAVLRRAASSPNIKERADCSAALFTAAGELLAQAEHIPVHLGSMPASVAAAIATGLADRADAQRSVRRRHAPQRPDDGGAGARRRRARGLGRQPRAPRRRRRHRARLDAARRADRRRGGAPTPARRRVDDASLARVVDVVAHARRAARRPRRPARRQPARRAPAVRARAHDGRRGASERAVRRDPRLRRTTDARRARATSPTAASPRPTCSTRPARVPSSRRRRASWSRSRIDGEDITFDFTGTDAQRPGNVNAVEAVTVSAVAFAIRAVTDPTLPANGGTLRPVHVVAPPGTVVAAVPPVAVGAGNVEVSQRVADVCLAALAQAATRAGRRRQPGHDEQRAARRRATPAPVGALRDRSAAARAAGRGPTA